MDQRNFKKQAKQSQAALQQEKISQYQRTVVHLMEGGGPR